MKERGDIMNFKDIEEIVLSITDKAKIEYCEKMPIYYEDDDDYDKRRANNTFISMWVHMNEYKILISGLRFKDNKRINEASLGVFKGNEDLNQIVFNIEDENYNPMIDDVKCNRTNVKKSLKWVVENTAA